jgi:6-phosphogluconolactonase (cycloisomerase 2 family)
MAVHIDSESGKPGLINEKESLAPMPSYIWLDKTKRYALVTHHCGRGYITKISKNDEGFFSSKAFFDDAALVLFRINEDGSFGDICDVLITAGEGVPGLHTVSRQHFVMSDPSDRLWLVCDKGTDRIYSVRVDREKGKIKLLCETIVETGCAPRYGVFHPSLPYFYENNENKPILFVYRYDTESGALVQTGKTFLVADIQNTVGSSRIKPADIVIHPSGNYLYVSLRGSNQIVVLDIDAQGGAYLKQTINSEGQNPRGLCFSPDHRYLFAANTESGTITAFAVGDDGKLIFAGEKAKASCPANIKFLEV